MGKHYLDPLFTNEPPNNSHGGCVFWLVLCLVPFIFGVQYFGYEVGIWVGAGFYIALFVILMLLRRRR
jgi:hypothetical protein